ncbi:hypothetical protein G6F40_015542 [Rhizopus arrhizus]|nr:hypothetical protein G6F40_015542 [Rhizopus arrhizus]
MERARNAAQHEQRSRSQAGRRRHAARHQAQRRENECQRRRREHFEEALDPQVHDPPAPNSPIAPTDAVSSASRFLSPPGLRKAGTMPRSISTSQKQMPANLPICHSRPRSTYS